MNNEWQPIETAPIDTNILILTKDGRIDVAIHHYSPAHVVRIYVGEDTHVGDSFCWRDPYSYDWIGANGFKEEDLTRWMPLPEALK